MFCLGVLMFVVGLVLGILTVRHAHRCTLWGSTVRNEFLLLSAGVVVAAWGLGFGILFIVEYFPWRFTLF